MNGAEALLEVLVKGEVEVCFANPGTSEMQLVSAIGNTDKMRAILCLFEGVVSGAADGYGRMLDKPAATLLHVGSGFSNSMANLHNAKRANVPLINIVGDHATYHMQYDAPLTSDVPAHANINSHFVRVSESAADLAVAGAEVIEQALKGSGKVSTLIVPANHAWEENDIVPDLKPYIAPKAGTEETISKLIAALSNGKKTAFFIGGRALREEALDIVGQIAEAHDAVLLCETFPTRMQRGSGRVKVSRLPYFAEQASEALAQFEQIILLGAKAPVSFFAYPGKKSWLAPEGCEILELANTDSDMLATLKQVKEKLLPMKPANNRHALQLPEVPSGSLSAESVGASLAILMPENAIVSDEGATCGLSIYAYTESTVAHDWMTLTGGAIGQGLPLSLGAAIACPDRKVISLQADGSAMYTVQALWTMAREKADVTVILLNNQSYAILNIELARVGAGVPTEKTLSMLDLSNPGLDWVSLAQGMGVTASRATTAEEFHQQLEQALATPGPVLVEAMV